MRPIGRALLPAIGLAAVAMLWPATGGSGPRAEDALANPYLGDPQAVSEGRRLYRRRCILCHRHGGGRGPNLFASGLSDEQFLETVINGRAGMPAFGYRMSPDEVWRVHAFVKSRDRY